ncbi:outer membrane protein assembly factor BamD [Rickettsiales endosymbiont of Stachyamoeba lipophora]|uniref:outer membrane protein assembly factor BamD n=1 Tax=Rickettsiales endosymbiont of Stachyamoeba lipophora TaxID=2486578 RepID=UPI000F646B0B|nr:outer membrane protein assembly factor BamD [Rickettsiales endosymbiont of Stachyamoeba lipophora]AZL14969.1 outer membrane protein assembly factor BamD [Rickettsiales endosymbiont of Stachyamoeba lipophora]
MLSKVLFIIIFLFSLTSCNHNLNYKEEEPNFSSAEEAFNKAFDYIKIKDYHKANQTFEVLEKEFPFSTWATHGQLINAYLNYEQGIYGEALANLERFLQLHPTHKHADYALYLKGMIFYVQVNTSERDQKNSYEAKETFENLIAQFPNSVYAKDAKFKIDLVNDHLAGQQMEIGRFYQSKNSLVAAVNRYNIVIEQYQNTIHVSEALYRLVEIYMTLGLKGEALKYASILGHNYPHNPWYHRAYDLMTNTDKYYLKNNKWYKKLL